MLFLHAVMNIVPRGVPTRKSGGTDNIHIANIAPSLGEPLHQSRLNRSLMPSLSNRHRKMPPFDKNILPLPYPIPSLPQSSPCNFSSILSTSSASPISRIRPASLWLRISSFAPAYSMRVSWLQVAGR